MLKTNTSDCIEIAELLGDGIGPELEKSVAMVAEALPLDFKFNPVDWSLDRRERLGEQVIDEAEEAIKSCGVALKYPTVTKSSSPNALFRRRCEFSVIYRPTVTIHGIPSNFTEDLNVHIIRIATGGTYDDPGQHIGQDVAVSLRMVEKKPCEHAAAFAFELAKLHGWKVTSASKYTIQKITDGLFEAVVRKVHQDYQEVEHTVELFDALLGKIILKPADYQVVLVLNEYGDFLSDMASGLVGSLGTGCSGNYAFHDDHSIKLAMFDPAGGTAPDIAGMNICNPTAILLAFAMLLDHVEHIDFGDALRKGIYASIEAGESTSDIGGKLKTDEFTKVVIDRMADSLES